MGYAALAATTSRSQLARAVLWGESDVHDYARFPARKVAAGPTAFRFRHPAGGAGVPPLRTVRVLEDGRPIERDLEQFLAASDTTAFLIVRGDTLLYEGYFNGYDHDATQTSMSIAKSVLWALVGIAVGEGRIGSVDDPITRYVPELLERDRRFERITLRHLLTMRSGIRYREEGTPWSDDTATYYAPDLRVLALERTEIVEEPGRRFHYNNYNPLLVGLALERATGMPVATYLERRLWQPLGMEADGSWSLDSRRSGFEKMESGLNGGPSTSPSSACCTPAAAPGGAASEPSSTREPRRSSSCFPRAATAPWRGRTTARSGWPPTSWPPARFLKP